MKAYDLAMGLIFINAGIYITAMMNLFGDLSDVTGIFSSLSIFYTPILTVPYIDYPLKGIDAIAIALALGTIVVANTNAIQDRGIAYIAFSTVFWGSFLMTSVVINKIDFPGISVFYSVFFLASSLIFVMTLIQMPTGGQRSYV
jgi:hypothetical protein